jgi:hypothetical protein
MIPFEVEKILQKLVGHLPERDDAGGCTPAADAEVRVGEFGAAVGAVVSVRGGVRLGGGRGRGGRRGLGRLL